MGASRKLQGEIDRVLKKVQEGVDVFDSIWNKVYDTDNANQKEKFEADLKKEIKKLQRYRDQIKTWIQSSEIKDKKVSASYEQALVDARKLIEREMERFKICEKETKTKAFSKEGLGQQPKTDPKEKAKSETRDWLNNVVSELESQIDSFEAELEGLTVKKGKARPPRLTHLETSITRHKAHIMKLELILRLLDNDELSPEQVNDVKDFLDDYVERNQDDFDEFSDVDELYSSLPLDKGAPVHSLKTSLAVSATQVPATVTSTHQHSTSVQVHVEDTASQDGNSDNVVKTPPAKSSGIGSSITSTPAGSVETPISINAPGHSLPNVSNASAVLPGSTPGRGVLDNTGNVGSPSSVNLTTAAKEEDVAGFPGRRPSPAITDIRGISRGGLSNQPPSSIPPSSAAAVPSNGNLGAIPTASDGMKRNILGADERLGSSGMAQPLVSPLGNRMILSQAAAKANDGTGPVDPNNAGESMSIGGRVFNPSVVSGMQWRPGSAFQNQNEPGQFRGRTEIAPDQREKFLQRLQQVQQQGHSTLLGMPALGGNPKQFSSQQQNPLLQQFTSQSSPMSPQSGLGLGLQGPGLSTVTSNSLQQQPISVHHQASQQGLIASSQKDALVGHLSDRCTSRFGRRRPFIVAGAAAICIAVLLIGYAADIGGLFGDTEAHRPRAIAVFVFGFWILDVANNMTQGPCRALLADLTGKDHRRNRVANAYFSLFMAIGNIFGYATGSYSNWFTVFSFTHTSACNPDCANLKSAFLIDIIFIAFTTCLSISAADEVPLSSRNVSTPLLEDGAEESSPTQEAFLWELFGTFRYFSGTIWIILTVTALTWIGWFPFLLFDTDWMGREIYGGKPNGGPIFAAGVRMGALGLMLNSVVLGITSVLMEKLCRKWGAGFVWGVSNILMALCFLLMLIVSFVASHMGYRGHDQPPVGIVTAALIIFTILGVPLSITYSVPYALISSRIESLGLGQGLSLGVLNLAIVIPQVLVSVGSGPWDQLFGGGNSPAFAVGGFAAFAGGILAILAIPRSSAQKPRALP